MGEAVTNSTRKGWLTGIITAATLWCVLLIASWVAILELGAWTGTLYSGVLAERISRKYTILVNVVIFCLGVIVQTTAAVGDDKNILGGRFVTGMGVGRYGIFFQESSAKWNLTAVVI